jgi:uncharacterized membrane protein YfcA
VLPEVATATAAFMLFFTTGTSAAAYAFFGLIDAPYAGLFATTGFVFALLGQAVSNYMLRRHGKSAVLILVMAGLTLPLTPALTGTRHGSGRLGERHSHDHQGLPGL